MKQLNVKKLVLLNLPYLLLGLFATNLGEAWRLAVGADASAKMLSFFSTLPVALGSWWPSLHPLDLLVGLCCGAGLRLAVYLKGKNAKKYRHNVEYGSARWGTHDDIAPYIDPVFQNTSNSSSRSPRPRAAITWMITIMAQMKNSRRMRPGRPSRRMPTGAAMKKARTRSNDPVHRQPL